MENKIDLTVIVPITSLDDVQVKFLKTAIESVQSQTLQPKNILFIGSSKEVVDKVQVELKSMMPESYSSDTIIDAYNVIDGAGFCELVNEGVKVVNTKYFTLLEANSEFLPKYFSQVQQYIDSDEYQGKSLYLPTTALMSDKGMMLQFINDAAWAQGVAEVMGSLDFNLVKERNVFVLGGGVFKTEDFIEAGGFKSDIKIYFAYEFLLRFLYSDFGVMVTPKIGYKHFINENGSLYSAYRDANVGITEEEAIFYLDSAKKEYLFNPKEIKREIKYSPVAAE